MSRYGECRAAEHEFSLVAKEEETTRHPAAGLTPVKVRKWVFLGWGGPFNIFPRWKHAVVGFHYFNDNGRRVLMPWEAK